MVIDGELDIRIDESEILRPLGYSDTVPESEILECIRDEIRKCREYIKPKLVYEKIKIWYVEKDRVVLENHAVFEGEYIARKLGKCEYVVLTVSTLGSEIDDIINECFNKGDYLRGMVIDTIGSAYIEYVNRLSWNRLVNDIIGTDMGITSRLSPGTGGWDISDQAMFFQCIDGGAIGVTLVDSYMMLPLKSTSIAYGFGKEIGIARVEHICSECNMKECVYRMDNKVEIKVKSDTGTTVIYGDKGASLHSVLRSEGIAIQSPCGGKGVCGKCRVQVINGDKELSSLDIRHLSKDELDKGIRLACAFKLYNPVEIQLLSENDTMNVITEGSEINIRVEPCVEKIKLNLAVPSLEDQRSDKERLTEGIEKDGLIINNELLSKMPDILREGKFNVTAAVYKDILLDIEPGDTSDKAYGMAVDIGTTTVACYLMNLFTGRILDVESGVNMQRAYGADVISRINYTIEDENGTARLKSAVVEQINTMISKLCTRNGLSKQNIYNMAIAGNTTMIHMLLGLPSQNIAIAPYIPVTTGAMEMQGREIGIDINGYVSILPGVSGYVGSDIVAGILACGIHRSEGYSLLLDLGTNGEMALGNREGIITCSTAAGPAFEGASIKWGAGGVEGAISKVNLSKNKVYETIGDKKPCGMCGSGVLDMVSELLKYNLVDETGRMADLDELSCVQSLKDRMVVREGKKEFIIEGDITFTQKDVREVQLAKAAVCAGIKILLKEKGISTDDVENIFIAGGFGSYMDIKSALDIGLIPREFKGKSKSVGNSAGTGARMCILSREYRDEIESIVKISRYIELSARQDFQDYYIDSMMLGG